MWYHRGPGFNPPIPRDGYDGHVCCMLHICAHMLWQVVRSGRKRKGGKGKGVIMFTSVLQEGLETGIE